MTQQIKKVATQQELLERIYGYADSALGSAVKHGPDAPGVHISLGFARSQINRYFELSKRP